MSEDETPVVPVDQEPTFKPIPRLEVEPDTDKPPMMVVRDTFIAQSDQGEVRMPLSIPRKTVRAMAEVEGAYEQIDFLLESRGDQENRDRLDSIDDVEATIITRGFFEAYAMREVLRLGESLSSSTS